MMEWLVPSIIATLIGTIVLASSYSFLYFSDRRRYLGIWCISWCLYSIRFILMLFYVHSTSESHRTVLLISNQLVTLASGMFLMWGAYVFIRRKMPAYIVYLSISIAIYIVFIGYIDHSIFYISLPTFLFLGFVYFWNGIIFLRQNIAKGLPSNVVGISFVIWGLHKADYPFLRPLAGFAPWGYLLGATLEIIVAIGILMLYFQHTRRRMLDKERALSESEENYRQLVELSPEPIFIHQEGRLVFFNRALLRLLGYRRSEDLMGRSPMDFVSPEYREAVGDRIGEVSRNERAVPFMEQKILRADGSHAFVESSAIPCTYNGRKAVQVVARDITHRKRSEEILRESEARYRSVLDTVNEGIILQADSGEILTWNKAAERIFGIPAEQAIGQTSEGKDWPTIREDGTQYEGRDHPSMITLRTGKPCRNEIMGLVQASGEIRWISANTNPLFREGERKPHAVAVSFSDVTELKQAMEKLEAGNERFRLIAENSMDDIWQLDLRGNIVYVSPAVERIFGYSVEEALALDFTGFFPEKEQSRAREAFVKALSGEPVQVVELQAMRKDGTGIPIEVSVSPIVKDDEVVGVQGIARDITDRKIAEEEKERLEAQLRQAHKMEAIGTLAGGIAHDFNNILGIIVGNTELAMLDLPRWSPVQESLKEVREATLRARELVTQILLFARKKEHATSDIRVEPIAKESLKMLRASIPTTVHIEQRIEAGLPHIVANPAQVQQIIMNLCSNASQVMEADGGTLELSLSSLVLDAPLDTLTGTIPAGRYVCLRVRDTGPGIAPEQIEHIFEPFYTTKGVGEGTGLGLAVVHGIVQDRSGGIVVESREGQGAALTVYLPASEREEAADEPGQEEELPRGSERILFVDDEPMIIRLGGRILERQGYAVETCSSGRDALACFKRDPERFDLVLTDMTMPGMRGDRLAEEIMSIRPEIPVILCTGYSRQISEEKAREAGIRALVMKPLTAGELANAVRSVLDETRSR